MGSITTSTQVESQADPAAGPHRAGHPSPLLLVLGCTIFAAAAQVLLKFGAMHPMPAMPADLASSGVIIFVKALLGNWQLLLGYSLHACNATLLILALRHGELSVLYPVYALSYIWVDLLSLYFFHEHMNVWKTAGIVLVMGGVALLGRVSTRA